jgi:hypothetical protein
MRSSKEPFEMLGLGDRKEGEYTSAIVINDNDREWRAKGARERE